jgi:hypothetical protein
MFERRKELKTVVRELKNSIAILNVILLQANGTYDNGMLYEEGKVPIHIFDGESIDLKDVF